MGAYWLPHPWHPGAGGGAVHSIESSAIFINPCKRATSGDVWGDRWRRDAAVGYDLGYGVHGSFRSRRAAAPTFKQRGTLDAISRLARWWTGDAERTGRLPTGWPTRAIPRAGSNVGWPQIANVWRRLTSGYLIACLILQGLVQHRPDKLVMILYHFTTVESVEAIKREGLQAWPEKADADYL